MGGQKWGVHNQGSLHTGPEAFYLEAAGLRKVRYKSSCTDLQAGFGVCGVCFVYI